MVVSSRNELARRSVGVRVSNNYGEHTGSARRQPTRRNGPSTSRTTIRTIRAFILAFALLSTFYQVLLAHVSGKADTSSVEQNLEQSLSEHYLRNAMDDHNDDAVGLNVSYLSFFQDIEAKSGGHIHSLEIAKEVIDMAADYLVKDAKRPMKAQQRRSPPKVDLNCGQLDYSRALTGKPATSDKYIIDVVPFGFDVDYLEIRLLEYYDLIDKFVIVEQDTNLKGVPKPFLLPKILATPRFARFKEKIEYIPFRVPVRLKASVRPFNGTGTSMDWRIEERMRAEPIEYLRATLFLNTTISKTNVFVIQNDGDEIITRRAMAHFKFCEVKNRRIVYPFYFPCLTFKRNVAWLQESNDMQSIRLPNETFGALRSVLWRQGPGIWRWKDVAKAGSTKRVGYKYKLTPHFGLGAAYHFSNPAHPVLLLLKLLSTVDGTPHRFSPNFWQKVHDRTIADRDIEREMFACKSSDTGIYKNRVVHISKFGPLAQSFIEDNLPWSIKETRYQYPWLYSDALFEKEMKLFNETCGTS